ncbi:metal-dependent hydrolase [Pseudalkalibacillus salsuginis]|uniref:metal-dependent hydrolase n=1 Tax=Pseudalkalibacillus salsuginis TaxID=2910972 RepID=UPI001F3C878A|nr:metal-dependent hydrolase [Pseudalkalibacillus salsuginis]MCF6411993.1 metal-dependent hydrolase [Pseudalkalibacillus salsuginis]
MDTGTHIVMGIGLGGLATLDPVIAQDPLTTQVVLMGTIIGSNAPDFDTILKLKSNAVYLRNHRGITHSIPAVVFWPLLIVGCLEMFFPGANMLHVWLWTFLSVFLHVFVDIFNSYGTQALHPFSKKWIAHGMINIFDPFIFFAHIVGFILWYQGFNPGYTFLTIYIVLIGYYIWRYLSKRQTIKMVKKEVPDATKVIVCPTIRWGQKHVAVMSPGHFHVIEVKNDKLTIHDEYERKPVPKNPIVDEAVKDSNLAAFLSFSPVYRWEVEEDKEENGYEVRFIDLRYRSKGHYPFVAVVKLDEELNITSSFTGWVYSEKTLRRKLDVATTN